MTSKKYKRMTAAEKKWNKEYKQEMIEKGVLPPPKAPLNRKKFCKEVHADWDGSDRSFFRLHEALLWLVPAEDTCLPITAEQLGVLKLMKLAVAIERFWKQKEAEGETKSTYGELYEAVVKPIIDL